MPMLSNDLQKNPTLDEIRQSMQAALAANDSEKFSNAMTQLMSHMQQETMQKFDELREEQDTAVLQSRGIRQLTSAEKTYYQKLTAAMRSSDPTQALANLDVVMPKTVIESVFEDLEASHPLLGKIDFMQTSAAIKMIVNVNGYQKAEWGELCDEITKEMNSGFKRVDTGLCKLSAFFPICNAMLDLGPQWLDSYIRRVLAEMIAAGLEYGILLGDGNDAPIGMNRQVGTGVTVTDGVYPEKTAIKVTDLSVATIGNLLSILAQSPNGQSRPVRDVILVVNQQDYFQRIMPASTIMAPDGTYRNNVLPYPITILQSAALPRGKAIMGLPNRYFAALGSAKNGTIEFSDHLKFLEDARVYRAKLYGNGMPKDNNAFLVLDITGLAPATYKVTQVTAPAASTDATLSDLRIGSLSLSPAFAAATVTYTAATTNATNTVTAIPANAGASISVKIGTKEIDNGSAATWATGANTLTVTVTAADGQTTKTYTVTVTKS